MTLPRVQPIIPTWRKEPFDDPEWLFDFKYDGFRALCYLERGRCRIISRNGNVLSRFEALGEQVAPMLEVDEAIIDGEVKPRCPTTSSRCRSASTLGSRWPAFLLELIDDLGQELLALPMAGALPGALQRRQRCFLARAGHGRPPSRRHSFVSRSMTRRSQPHERDSLPPIVLVEPINQAPPVPTPEIGDGGSCPKIAGEIVVALIDHHHPAHSVNQTSADLPSRERRTKRGLIPYIDL
jgi:hypothetical protein